MDKAKRDEVRARLEAWQANGWIYRANASFMPGDIDTLLKALDERDARIADLEAALDDILIALSDDNLNPDDDSGDYQMSMINEAHDIARKAKGE